MGEMGEKITMLPKSDGHDRVGGYVFDAEELDGVSASQNVFFFEIQNSECHQINSTIALLNHHKIHNLIEDEKRERDRETERERGRGGGSKNRVLGGRYRGKGP